MSIIVLGMETDDLDQIFGLDNFGHLNDGLLWFIKGGKWHCLKDRKNLGHWKETAGKHQLYLTKKMRTPWHK